MRETLEPLVAVAGWRMIQKKFISHDHEEILYSFFTRFQKLWAGRRRGDGVVEPVHLQPQEHHPVQGQLARRVHARRATPGKTEANPPGKRIHEATVQQKFLQNSFLSPFTSKHA